MKIVGPIKMPALLDDQKVVQFKLYLFRQGKNDYYVLTKGKIKNASWPFVRLHSACNIAQIFHSQRCDCHAQLVLAMQRINQAKKGLVIYIVSHEGRGVGPFNHLRVYQKQDEGYDTLSSYQTLHLPVDSRDYSEIKKIFQWFKIKKIKLLTNNPKKINAVKKMGIEFKREPLIAKLHRYNKSQIEFRMKKLGHLMSYGKK